MDKSDLWSLNVKVTVKCCVVQIVPMDKSDMGSLNVKAWTSKIHGRSILFNAKINVGWLYFLL